MLGNLSEQVELVDISKVYVHEIHVAKTVGGVTAQSVVPCASLLHIVTHLTCIWSFSFQFVSHML